jgi:cell shape-determining protein MreD
MFTIRTMGGVALFLAGTTWLWLTPAFASKDVTRSGALWTASHVLSLITVAAFLVATWGLFARHSWWEPAALAAAGIGLITLLPYWAAATGGGETTGTTAWNAFVHVVVVAGIFALLLIPKLEHWVDGHVMTG